MTIYGISGLGADERVFKYLELSQIIQPIHWIKPTAGESIRSYTLRLSAQIKDDNFILIAVSFGGLVAVELSKILNPKLTILISSAETKYDLRLSYRLVGKTGLLKVVPSFLINPPKPLMYWLFGARNKKLLGEILEDTDLDFARWAMIQLTSWTNTDKVENLVKVHGTSDKLIPYRQEKRTIPVIGGEHFMIVDKAKEISAILQSNINTL